MQRGGCILTDRTTVNMAWSCSIHYNVKVKSTISCKIHTKQIDNAFQMESFVTCPGTLLKQEWLLLKYVSANTSICTNPKVEWYKDSCISIMPCKIITVTTVLNTWSTLKLLVKWLSSLAYNYPRNSKKPDCLFLHIFRCVLIKIGLLWNQILQTF